MRLYLDFETKSECDLFECGAYRYALDESTRILMVGLALDDEPPVIWLPKEFTRITNWYTAAEYFKACDLLAMLENPEVEVWSHFAGFEIAVADARLLHDTGFKPPSHKQWRCTAAMARCAALPDSLDMLAKVLRLPHEKDKEGKALIDTFCEPQKPSNKTRRPPEELALMKGKRLDVETAKPPYQRWVQPWDRMEDFRRFTEYCKKDVIVERLAGKRLSLFELKGFPLRVFQFDIEMNARGMPVNLKALRNAQAIMDEVGPVVAKEFQDLTGLTPTQGVRFKEWATERGYTGDNLQADTVEAFMDGNDFDPDSVLGQALILRQKVSFAAIAKIPKMLACHVAGWVRGTLLWHGAGPGRWTAKLIQPQNMKRPVMSLLKNMPWRDWGFEDTDEALDIFTQTAYRAICDDADADTIQLLFGEPLDVLASCVRHFIHDVEGGPMLSCDYSAIEAVLLAWLAGEEWRLDVFRTHGKIYEASACQMFGLKMGDITKPIRQKGKIAELALGYQGSVGALIQMGALKMGLKEEELKPIVDAWRKANPNIAKLWKDCEKAAKAAVLSPGQKVKAGRCEYFSRQAAGMNYLFCRLPSGRCIAYPQPKIESQLRYAWGDPAKGKKVKVSILQPVASDIALAQERVGDDYYIKDSLTVFGQIKENAVGRFPIHGGIFVENQCMGSAADIMFVGAVNLDDQGYRIFSLVHDEAVSAFEPEKGQSPEEMESLMLQLPPWADGLPLKAVAGVIPFYKK